jgi:hypothetical protein
MQSSHAASAVSAAFDDTNLVAYAGLVPVMRLAERCGLARLTAEKVKLAASTAAAGFQRALRAEDSVAACAALAPATRRELERSAKSSCSQAVTERELTPTADVWRVDVYGQQARVVFDADTVFLSRFSSGWKVTAAGCTARREHPYECEIKGG